jgi:hypothetical protein
MICNYFLFKDIIKEWVWIAMENMGPPKDLAGVVSLSGTHLIFPYALEKCP